MSPERELSIYFSVSKPSDESNQSFIYAEIGEIFFRGIMPSSLKIVELSYSGALLMPVINIFIPSALAAEKKVYLRNRRSRRYHSESEGDQFQYSDVIA